MIDAAVRNALPTTIGDRDDGGGGSGSGSKWGTGSLTGPWRRSITLFRWVQIGVLASLLWKYDFFFGFARQLYVRSTIVDDFFPSPLQSTPVLFALFLTTVATGVVSMADGRSRFWWVAIQWLGCTGLCLHQESYNDATFTTSWWTITWLGYLAHRMRKPNDAPESGVLDRAAMLSRAIVSLILLGGAVGKFTADYWSGQVLYDIYFVDRDFWTFNYVRNAYDPATLREIARWYSRMVVVTETVFGVSLWLMPTRIAATAGMLLLASIAIFSNFLLFSVMACLIALVSAGLFVPRGGPHRSPEPTAAANRFQRPPTPGISSRHR